MNTVLQFFVLSKLKKYFEEKSIKKKEIDTIKAFIINKNEEIVENFIDYKKPTKEGIKKRLIKIKAIDIDNFGFPFSFSFKFKNFKNLQFDLAIGKILSFGCYGIDDLHGFKCDLIKPISLKDYPARFAAGYFLVSVKDKKQNNEEINNILGKEVYEGLKEAEKKIKNVDKNFKFKSLNWETTDKAKLLYKNMLNTSNGYINEYTANEMFR